MSGDWRRGVLDDPHDEESRRRSEMISRMDDLLRAIDASQPLSVKALQGLPPWRALLLAQVGAKAGAGLERGSLDQLHAEAAAVGGLGVLGAWWERELPARPGTPRPGTRRNP